jgi:DNA repair protein RadC
MSTPYRLIRESCVHRAQSDPGACSYVELLTAVIGAPLAAAVAERVLTRYPTPFDLGRAGAADLLAIPGVGPQTAAALRAACELSRRAAAPHPAGPIRTAAEAAAVLRPYLAHREQEYLYVLNLNTRNHLIGDPVEVYHGSLNTSLIRVGEVFRPAVKDNASGIIVAHNHPSGDPSPSADDVAVSKALGEAGALLDIGLIDHVVIGHDHFVSLRERGLLS